MSPYQMDRREFLKLTGMFSLGLFAPRFLYQPAISSGTGDQKNIIIIIFDAFSALHAPFYGYARNTMPKVSQLAERAIVYHNHYSAGNFTTPGTASLLTGTLPWTHRALGQFGKVAENLTQHNIFSQFPDFHRTSYSHNRYANTIIEQFLASIDQYTPRQELFLEDVEIINKLLKNDEDIASVSWVRGLNQREQGSAYSLFLSRIYGFFQAMNEKKIAEVRKNYPRGIPRIKEINSYFVLEHAIDYLMGILAEAPQPHMGYYHFLPPHDPYNTRKDFYDFFLKDGYLPLKKPDHLFSGTTPYEQLAKWSTWYDEYILYVDSEFARLYDFMETNGMLENTWLILTSDHGELFERSFSGHSTEMLFQPIVRVPLLIFEPGRTARLDIHDNTSSIDLIPTLLHLSGKPAPDWLEGTLLPPYNTAGQNPRDLFAFEAKETPRFGAIRDGSAMLVRGNYKLIYYFGYEELGEKGELIELYDLARDPEELENRYPAEKSTADQMVALLKEKIAASNQPYL